MRAQGYPGLGVEPQPQRDRPIQAALTSTISSTLNAVDAKLTTSALLALDIKVIVDKENYTTAAKDWLQSVGLG